MPLTAARDVVPARLELPGLLLRFSVMTFVADVTVLPGWSRMATCRSGENGTPATSVAGCTTKATWLAVPGVTLKAVLVAAVNPAAGAVAARVYPVPANPTSTLVKVATPLVAPTVSTPEAVAPPLLELSATAIDALDVVRVDPFA